MWIGGAPMNATGCPHSLLRQVVEFQPLGPAQKQVWFDLVNDLGDALSPLMHLSSCLGEDITDKKIDAQCPLLP